MIAVFLCVISVIHCARGVTMAPRKGKQKTQGSESEVKVKRKCGRPRNPIPRHKRVSHINAEHRRRGKIQNGFQTLKSMVPKYESSGRDSKADILTKSVEHCKATKKECKEQERQLRELRAQKQALSADIQRHQQNLPEGKLSDEQPMSAEQRFSNLVSRRTEEDWKYFIFSFFTKPLHESFERTTDCSSVESFLSSAYRWADTNLSQASLRPVATEALCNLSTETSFIDKPDMMREEALKRCHRDTKPATCTLTPAIITTSTASLHKDHHDNHHQPTHKQNKQSHEHNPNHKTPSNRRQSTKNVASQKRVSLDPHPGQKRAAHNVHPHPSSLPSPSKKTKTCVLSPQVKQAIQETVPVFVKSESVASCSLQFPGLHVPVKLETRSPPNVETVSCPSSYMPPADQPFGKVDSPYSDDSAIALSPPGLSHDSSLFGGYESSLDRFYDMASITPTDSPASQDFLEQPGSAPIPSGSNVLADLEHFDNNFIDICQSWGASASSPQDVTYPQILPQALPQPVPQPDQCFDNLPNLPIDPCSFLDEVDTSSLLEGVDLFSDPNSLLNGPARSFLGDDAQYNFDFLLDCDYDDLNLTDTGLLAL